MATTLALVFVNAAFARITSTVAPVQIAASADAIIKGEVLDVLRNTETADVSRSELADLASAIGPYHPTIGIARVRVKRVIKGKIEPPVIDVRFFTSEQTSFIVISKGATALFFLKLRGGKYFLFSPDDGIIVASTHTITSPEADSADTGTMLASEYATMAEEADGDVAAEGVLGLTSLNRREYLPLLKRLSQNKAPLVRARAIAGRVRMGDTDSPTDLLRELDSSIFPASTDATAHSKAEAAFLGAINSLAHSSQPGKLSIIITLAGHKNASIRRQALQELRGLKSEESIPALVKLLDSADKTEQYTAVITLCNIAHPNGVGCPSGILFERDRNKFISEWKAWAQDHQTKK